MDLSLIFTILTVLLSFFIIIYVTAYYLISSRYEKIRRFDRMIMAAVILFALGVIITPFYSTVSMFIVMLSLLLFFIAFYFEFKWLAYFHSQKFKSERKKHGSRR